MDIVKVILWVLGILAAGAAIFVAMHFVIAYFLFKGGD